MILILALLVAEVGVCALRVQLSGLQDGICGLTMVSASSVPVCVGDASVQSCASYLINLVIFLGHKVVKLGVNDARETTQVGGVKLTMAVTERVVSLKSFHLLIHQT